MFWLILNLWLMGFIFLGCIIQCLDSTYKNLQNINDNLESIRKELTIIRSNTYIHDKFNLLTSTLDKVATILDKKIKW